MLCLWNPNLDFLNPFRMLFCQTILLSQKNRIFTFSNSPDVILDLLVIVLYMIDFKMFIYEKAYIFYSFLLCRQYLLIPPQFE